MPKSRTLPSRSRTRVLQAYRSRGRANRNLWLVYSQKTNRDWILGSDRHLVHWITFLESNPEVRTFELGPVGDMSPEGAGVAREGIDAAAELRSGEFEYHVLMRNGQRGPDDNFENVHDGKRVRVFTETDLFARGAEAMRWLHLVGYCGAIRDEQQQEVTLACVAITRSLGHGTLGQVLDSLSAFDREVTIGVFSRLVVRGDIAIDLSSSAFTLSTHWAWRTVE